MLMQKLHAFIRPFAGKSDRLDLGFILHQTHGIDVINDPRFLCLQHLTIQRREGRLDSDDCIFTKIPGNKIIPVLSFY